MGFSSLDVGVTLVALILLSLNRESGAATYLNYYCSNSTPAFSPNSIYQSNLYELLSSLSSNVRREDGFYNTTVGRSTSDVVYGLFLCRGDGTVLDCQECVSTATQDVKRYCPIERTAVIWYEECMLRYSDQSFFSKVQTKPVAYIPSRHNISDPDRFSRLLMATMGDLERQVANVIGAKKFATKEANFTGTQILYTLGQCSPDISNSDCSMCIQEAIAVVPECCSGTQGARVISPSCSIRYEMYRFYRTSTAATAPSTTITTILPPRPAGKNETFSVRIIVPIVAAAVLLLAVVSFYMLRRQFRKAVEFQRLRRQRKPVQDPNARNDVSTLEKLVESLQFDLPTIEAATTNFSENNKLGTGGFGVVYKGVLFNGQEIAVKRLSGNSKDRVEEFKNEVCLTAKLQHRNLVRLLGFCLEGEEKMLIYEFVSNRSLDHFLYGTEPEKQRLLDWTTRYKIIQGIARGILYLHEDSRLTIIHRDLKASNVLLDSNMNPKISDLGISKIFEVDQTQGATSRVIGTYGYMAPEYAIYGQFSVKSDIYSFGVLVLEILSGKNNTLFFQQKNNVEDLRIYAWKHWTDGTPLAVLDPSLIEYSYSSEEVIRCIHIGLLCIQENPADRPTMASVVLMMNSYSIILPLPQQPSFNVLPRRIEPNNIMMPTKQQESEQFSSCNSIAGSVKEGNIIEPDPR